MQIEHEFKKEIEGFKEMNDEIVKSSFLKRGEYLPMITFFNRSQSGDFQLMPTPLPTELFDHGPGKDVLAKVLIPAMIEKINRGGATVLCLCFAHEAWMRVAVIPDGVDAANVTMRQAAQYAKDAERIEMLATLYETPVSSFSKNYKIIRSGARPTLELHDAYENPLTAEAGRFQNILRKQPSNN